MDQKERDTEAHGGVQQAQTCTHPHKQLQIQYILLINLKVLILLI